MNPACPTIKGGVDHGLQSLSPAERHAAQNALSKILNASTSLSSNLSGLSRSATQAGGSSATASAHVMQLQGAGSDTFVGGARSAGALTVGNDTVISGSSASVDGHAGVLGTQQLASFALNADTISAAGVTVLSIKSQQLEEGARSHTVTLTDKTTVTISGLSTHDISKLSH